MNHWYYSGEKAFHRLKVDRPIFVKQPEFRFSVNHTILLIMYQFYNHVQSDKITNFKLKKMLASKTKPVHIIWITYFR